MAQDAARPQWIRRHLSALLARVAADERIVLARHGESIAQLVLLDHSPQRQLGFLERLVDEAFFDPLLRPSGDWENCDTLDPSSF
jgi:antitoxin (DNA-binding transcriptional repressor) of toxin-antitoxin stability system